MNLKSQAKVSEILRGVKPPLTNNPTLRPLNITIKKIDLNSLCYKKMFFFEVSDQNQSWQTGFPRTNKRHLHVI